MKNEQKFSKEFYTKKAIEKSILDYKNIAEIKLYEEDKYFKCVFENCIYSVEITKLEFENYILGISCSG